MPESLDLLKNRLAETTAALKSAEKALADERTARRTDALMADLRAATAGFAAPETDVIPRLLSGHVPETGLFKIPVKQNDGSERIVPMPLGAAVKLWGEQHPHHLRPSGAPTPSNHTNMQGLKRGQMSDKAKSDFIDRHGAEAYQKLPR